MGREIVVERRRPGGGRGTGQIRDLEGRVGHLPAVIRTVRSVLVLYAAQLTRGVEGQPRHRIQNGVARGAAHPVALLEAEALVLGREAGFGRSDRSPFQTQHEALAWRKLVEGSGDGPFGRRTAGEREREGGGQQRAQIGQGGRLRTNLGRPV